MDYKLLTTVEGFPPGFRHVSELRPRDIRRGVFALFTDDFDSFAGRFGHLFNKLAGVVITLDSQFVVEELGEMLRRLTAPSWFAPNLQEQAKAMLSFIAALRQERQRVAELATDNERLQANVRSIAEFYSMSQERARGNLDRHLQWTIASLTGLVDFSFRQREHGVSIERRAAAFFLSDFFDNTGAKILRWDRVGGQWRKMAQAGDCPGDEATLPTSEAVPLDEAVEQNRRIIAGFAAENAKWLIVVYRDRPLEGFLRHELTFLHFFASLMAAALERKKLDQELVESERKYRSFFENALDGIFQVTPDGQLLEANPAEARILGYDSPEELIATSRDVRETFHVDPERRDQFVQLLQEKGEVQGFEVQLRRKDGKIIWGALTARNVLDETTGKVAYIEGILNDITTRKQTELALLQAKEQAEAASRLKSDFTSLVSHELRTPLTSVLGFTRLIEKRLDGVVFPCVHDQDEKVRRAIQQVSDNLKVILGEGQRLTELINDVLDLAKLEAGRVEWRMQPTNLAEIIDSAMRSMSALIEQKRLTAVRDIADRLPIVTCDPMKMQQVIVNLVSNAIKFTSKGSITCKVWREQDKVMVSVIDTGIGISQSQLTQVFDKFNQLGDTLTDKPKGTGLGLAICREIVERHGGRLTVRSRIGQGSAFTFFLPLHPSLSESSQDF